MYHHVGKNKGTIDEYPVYDVIFNFFAAKTAKVKSIMWDGTIDSPREHADFFLRARGILNVTHAPEFSVDHFQGERLLSRGEEQKRIDLFNKRWGIIDKIEVRHTKNPIRNFVKQIRRSVRVKSKRLAMADTLRR